jgi:RNA polymerase sigma factor (TIGR02999 family)
MAAKGPKDQVTEVVVSLESGHRADRADDLFPLVYDELRRLATSYMAHESPGHTLQPTALVHEAYLKLVDQTRVSWKGRTHFFAVGARIMRRLLIDHARERKAIKRGAGWHQVSLCQAIGAGSAQTLELDELLTLEAALERLAAVDQREARIVTLRFYGGLTVEEVAEVLEVSKRTVEADWRHARAWLMRELAHGERP